MPARSSPARTVILEARATSVADGWKTCAGSNRVALGAPPDIIRTSAAAIPAGTRGGCVAIT